MKKLVILIFAIMAVAGAVAAPRNNIWEEHGWVRVSDNHRYFQQDWRFRQEISLVDKTLRP